MEVGEEELPVRGLVKSHPGHPERRALTLAQLAYTTQATSRNTPASCLLPVALRLSLNQPRLSVAFSPGSAAWRRCPTCFALARMQERDGPAIYVVRRTESPPFAYTRLQRPRGDAQPVIIICRYHEPGKKFMKLYDRSLAQLTVAKRDRGPRMLRNCIAVSRCRTAVRLLPSNGSGSIETSSCAGEYYTAEKGIPRAPGGESQVNESEGRADIGRIKLEHGRLRVTVLSAGASFASPAAVREHGNHGLRNCARRRESGRETITSSLRARSRHSTISSIPASRAASEEGDRFQREATGREVYDGRNRGSGGSGLNSLDPEVCSPTPTVSGAQCRLLSSFPSRSPLLSLFFSSSGRSTLDSGQGPSPPQFLFLFLRAAQPRTLSLLLLSL